MVRLENYNITKITNDFIYYNKYENYIRLKITESDLIELKSSLENDIIFYNRMLTENSKVSKDIRCEIEHLKNLNEKRKQYILEHQENSLINYDYKESEKKIYNLTHEMAGIDIINSKIIDKIKVLEKAFRQCKIIVMRKGLE